jgi:3-oxoacyl-[acyl-carrier-protein] synthase II
MPFPALEVSFFESSNRWDCTDRLSVIRRIIGAILRRPIWDVAMGCADPEPQLKKRMAYQRGTPHTSGPHRVVVTGVGIITSLGQGCATNATGFREGRSGLRPITLFDTSKQRVQTGGEIVFNEPLPANSLSARASARLERSSRMLLNAGLEAWAQSGWEPDTADETVTPISLGTSAGAMPLGQDYFKTKTNYPSQKRGLATLSQLYQPHSQARALAQATGLRGPFTLVSNACASGANAIGHAFHAVKHGHARRVLAGGYDALAELVFAGFDSLQALSTTQPRPFAADRDGLALGEGAAVLTLERLADAQARGATVYAEITGYGATTDLHHLTQPHPEGIAAARSMARACLEAGVRPDQIDYINAHGTGTPLNDGSEGAAICSWAGPHVSGVRVSSTKGSIGHLLGGAGAVEAAICILAMRGGWVPPNVALEKPDDICRFDLVQSPRDADLRHVLTNSFGFGGANATLVLKKAS